MKPTRVGNVVIDPHRRIVTVDGRRVSLTPSEYKMLTLMAADPERCVTHEELIRNHYDLPADWGEFDLPKTRTITQVAGRLRKKTGLDIPTVWAIGYRLVKPALQEAA